MKANVYENNAPVLRRRISCSALALVLAAALLFDADRLAAQNPPQAPVLRDGGWVTDGIVYAFAQSDGIGYIGGDFNYVGPNTCHGVPLSISTGLPAGAFPRVEENIYACVADGAGGWFIGGGFTQVAGVARNRLAHILANGSLDSNWHPDVDGDVLALARSGAVLYVGGYFSHIDSTERNNAGAVDTTGGAVNDWNPDADGSVLALAVAGSAVYAGGEFSTIGGTTRHYAAALTEAAGVALNWNPDADGIVRALAIKTVIFAGKAPAATAQIVYAGGDFTAIGRQSYRYLASLDPATGDANAWNPDPNDSVRTLALSGSVIYAGGDFTYVGNDERDFVAAINVSDAAATAWA
ncbi:MAG: hypothetical protein M1457_12300, partial [bacterium]|nr:hypothetical protein [bacterium]